MSQIWASDSQSNLSTCGILISGDYRSAGKILRKGTGQTTIWNPVDLIMLRCRPEFTDISHALAMI